MKTLVNLMVAFSMVAGLSSTAFANTDECNGTGEQPKHCKPCPKKNEDVRTKNLHGGVGSDSEEANKSKEAK